MKAKQFYFCLALVILLALFLRLNHLLALFPFTMDEAYQAFLSQNMRVSGHMPLIGVNIADTGLYLGPFFTYLSFILYLLSQGSPISTAIAAPIIGGLTVFSLGWVAYQLTKQLKFKQPAAISLIASLFYAVSPLIVAYDKKFWNPSFLPLLGIWGLYSLFQIYQKKPAGFLILALLTGLAWHTHISFFVFSLAGIIISLYRRYQPPKKIWLQSLAILLIFFLPSLLFELRHQFIQSKSLYNYITTSPSFTFSLTSISFFLAFLARALFLPGSDLAQEISLCQPNLRLINPFVSIAIFSIILINIILSRKTIKKAKSLAIISGLLLLFFIFASFLLPGPVSEYYFLSLLPLMALLVGLAFASSKSSLSQLLIISYLAILAFQSFNLINTYGLSGKIVLINRTAKIIGQEPYELLASDNCRRYEGYGYLFSHYFKPPSSSYMDPFFSWLYTDSDIRTATQQVMLMPGPEVVIQSK
jgi:hypothetical protein